eukprot:179343_1
MNITDDPPPESMGTKRRGSTEMKDEEEEDDDNHSGAPDIEEDDDDHSGAPDIGAEENDDTVNELKKSKKNGLLRQPSDGRATQHRRRNTDGAINFTASGLPSNAAVIALMKSELHPSDQRHMDKKSSDLKLERELKHTLVKLREAEDQCKTAVEIIGNLTKQNEDLISEKEVFQTQLGAAQTEIKILDQKVKSLQESYRIDTNQQKQEIDSKDKKLKLLQEDMTQKDMALNEAKEYQISMQQRYDNEQQEEEENDNTNSLNTMKEKKLFQQLQNEKNAKQEKNKQI